MGVIGTTDTDIERADSLPTTDFSTAMEGERMIVSVSPRAVVPYILQMRTPSGTGVSACVSTGYNNYII
jgi:hypothetical protein